VEMMEEGRINCADVITHRLPLKDAPAVFEKIRKGGFYYNKIIFLPWEEA